MVSDCTRARAVAGWVWVLALGSACGGENKTSAGGEGGTPNASSAGTAVSGASGRAGSAAGGASAGANSGAASHGGVASGGSNAGAAGKDSGGGTSGTGAGGMVGGGGSLQVEGILCTPDVKEDGPCAPAGIDCLDLNPCSGGCRHNVFRCGNDGAWREQRSGTCSDSCAMPAAPAACALGTTSGQYDAYFVRLSGTCPAMLTQTLDLENGKAVVGDQGCAPSEVVMVTADGCTAGSKVHCQIGDDYTDFTFEIEQQSSDGSLLGGTATLVLDFGQPCTATFAMRLERVP